MQSLRSPFRQEQVKDKKGLNKRQRNQIKDKRMAQDFHVLPSSLIRNNKDKYCKREKIKRQKKETGKTRDNNNKIR